MEEIPGEMGIVLWQALRDVTLWASCPADGLDRLFAPGAERNRLGPAVAASTDRELEPPLQTLVALVREPERVPPQRVALACMQICQWADEHGALATALAFAESAAGAAPGDGGMACAAGRLARRRGDYARAETWYLRAVTLARQSGDWAPYVDALIGLGRIKLQRGGLRRAARRYGRALRAARRHGLRGLEGQTLHELFVVATEGGDFAEAEQYAREALHAYGAGHAKLPHLAHDLAHTWVLRGHFSRALPIFDALLPHLAQPRERLYTLADIARAAGGAGLRDRYHQAWEETWRLARNPARAEDAAPAVLDLAHGALGLGEWEMAEEAARYALHVATLRGEGLVRTTAEALLESVAAGRQAGAPEPTPEPAADDSLVEEFIRGLGACAVP